METLERLVPGVIAFSCRPEQPVPFLPGQYVLLQVPGGERRAYSMANTEAETLAFIVKEKAGRPRRRAISSTNSPKATR